MITVPSSKQLGRWTVRSVGIGELSLAVAAARGIDRSGSTRALHAALTAGFDLLDVAADPDSERQAGDALREMHLRDKVVVATRVPAIVGSVEMPTRDTLIERLPARYVVAQIEASLRSTKLDALPLVQLALRSTWRSSKAWPELVGTCARLVREGKVLEWGAFIDRVDEDTPLLVDEAWLASISVPYSLCERGAAPLLAEAQKPLPAADTGDGADGADNRSSTVGTTASAEPPASGLGMTPAQMRAAGLTPDLVIMAGLPAELVLATVADPSASGAARAQATRTKPMAVLARRPLAGAALAGTLGPGMRLRHRDDRNGIDPALLERVAVTVATLARFVKQVPPVARSTDAAKLQLEQNVRPDDVAIMTLAELALRYVLTRGAIALPRLHRHEHVVDAFTTSMLPPLAPELLEQLDSM